jgi:hypothetical protein
MSGREVARVAAERRAELVVVGAPVEVVAASTVLSRA